jgi:hypothetical protein
MRRDSLGEGRGFAAGHLRRDSLGEGEAGNRHPRESGDPCG